MNRLRGIGALFIIICSQLISFSPALVNDYAHRDDYIAVRFLPNHPDPLGTAYAKDGRWIAAILGPLMFGEADSIDKLWRLRLLAIIGNLGFAFLLWNTIRYYKPDSYISSSLQAAIISLTFSAAVYIGWTVCYPYTWGCLIAFLAGTIGLKTNKNRFWVPLSKFILIFISLTIYQPTTFLFFLPRYIKIWNAKDINKELKGFVCEILFFIGSLALYLITLILFLKFGFENADSVKRFSNPQVILQKLSHFLELIKNSFLIANSAGRSPYYFIQPVIVLSIIFAPLIFKCKNRTGLISKLFLAFILIAVSFTPVIASDSRIAGHRVIITSTVIIYLVFLFSIEKLIQLLNISPKMKYSVICIALGFILTLQVRQTFKTLKYGIVQPSIEEVNLIKEAILEKFDKKPTKMNYIMTPWHLPELAKDYGYAEFSRPSSNNHVNATWMLASIFDSSYQDSRRQVDINFVPPWKRNKFLENLPESETNLTIDAYQILKSHYSDHSKE